MELTKKKNKNTKHIMYLADYLYHLQKEKKEKEHLLPFDKLKSLEYIKIEVTLAK